MAARDWTFTDGEGKRWGVSPAGIHLGDLTLPVPGFGPASARRDEIDARLREWTEIQDQAERARILDMFEERIEAIRQRRDGERRDTTSSGG
jgi:hypothetical protein